MSARTRDERGQSVSVFITVVFAALIMTAGLVIDGGQKIAAASRAETAAAGAARAATNAGVTQVPGRRRVPADAVAPSRPGVPRRSAGRERLGHRERRRGHGHHPRQRAHALPLADRGRLGVGHRNRSLQRRRTPRRPLVPDPRTLHDHRQPTPRRTPAHAAPPAGEGTGGRARPATPEPPRLPARRNPKWIALGVIAICLGGLLSYVIYARVATESAVVAMAATVYRGEVIEAGDLTSITLSGDPSVPTVPADQAVSLVGQRAAYDLVDGSSWSHRRRSPRPRFPRPSARWSG